MRCARVLYVIEHSFAKSLVCPSTAVISEISRAIGQHFRYLRFDYYFKSSSEELMLRTSNYLFFEIYANNTWHSAEEGD